MAVKLLLVPTEKSRTNAVLSRVVGKLANAYLVARATGRRPRTTMGCSMRNVSPSDLSRRSVISGVRAARPSSLWKFSVLRSRSWE
jgi:hypothetical protein